MSADAEVRKCVRELQNAIKCAKDKTKLMSCFCEAAAFAKSSKLEESAIQIQLPALNPEAKNIFMKDHYSNFASFMLDILSDEIPSSLTKQEFLNYFASYFLDGCSEDALLTICAAIQKCR